MDQNTTPVLDAIEQVRREGLYSFALPGHRFGLGIDDRTAEVLSRGAFQSDVFVAKSAVPEAEKLYAEAVGARDAVFTTCGSSISVHTAMLTIIGPGDKVLVDRNVHKSVVSSLILAGAEPVWLRPSWDHENQIAHPATRDMVADVLSRHSDIAAVVVITPTEYGSGADIAGVAELAHQRGIPLLVDEAWGGHFGFHPDPPTAAVQAGADLAVQSLHKADGGLCQSSIILVGHGDLIDTVDLRLRLDLITTTSPSSLMYGSIDGWRRHLALHGKEIIDGAVAKAEGVRRRLQKVDGLSVIDESIHQTEGVAEWDPLKLSVDVSALGVTGYQVQEWLAEEHKINVQLSDARRVLLSITYADEQQAIDRFAEAMEQLAAEQPLPHKPTPYIPALEELNLPQVMAPRDAFFATTEQVTDPTGRVAAEMVSPYPPGVPAVLPGERFNEAVVSYLRAALEAGAIHHRDDAAQLRDHQRSHHAADDGARRSDSAAVGRRRSRSLPRRTVSGACCPRSSPTAVRCCSLSDCCCSSPSPDGRGVDPARRLRIFLDTWKTDAMRVQDPGDRFAAIARDLQNQSSHAATLDRIGGLALETIDGCDHAGITLLDRRERIIALTATDEKVTASDKQQRELGEGPLVDVLAQQEAVISDDLAEDERWPRWGRWVCENLGFRSMLSFQLFTTERSYGALEMFSDRTAGFDQHDQVVGLALAAHAAVAVASSHEVEHLNIGVVNRTVIGQAEGILMERYALSPEQAFAMLVRVSQAENRRLGLIAEELVATRQTPGMNSRKR